MKYLEDKMNIPRKYAFDTHSINNVHSNMNFKKCSEELFPTVFRNEIADRMTRFGIPVTAIATTKPNIMLRFGTFIINGLKLNRGVIYFTNLGLETQGFTFQSYDGKKVLMPEAVVYYDSFESLLYTDDTTMKVVYNDLLFLRFLQSLQLEPQTSLKEGGD